MNNIQNFALQSLLGSQSLTMVTTAYAVSKSANQGDKTVVDLKIEKKKVKALRV